MHTNILICGAGIIGLTLARELRSRGVEGISLLEAEPEIGLHASGRNSGVLHSGIYYAPESIRAKTCGEGARLMAEYCQEKGLPYEKNGKVIVAKQESELVAMEALFSKAKANGATVQMIDEKELADIEPLARTAGGRAIYSPHTAVVDPKAVLHALRDELVGSGKINILTHTRFEHAEGTTAYTSGGPISFKLFINAAGPSSDRVAHAFNLGREYALIPFKGIYHQFVSENAAKVRGSIYPVPDPRNTFLGVHFTRGINGNVYVGPTAIPALGRLNYGLFEGVFLGELLSILRAMAAMFFRNPGFRKVALEEPRKYIPRFFYEDARKLLHTLKRREIRRCPKVGLRPQLIHKKTWSMVMDFFSVQDENSFHLLNTVSPGFTSSMALAKTLADLIEKNYPI
ncbi:MAG: FAD-dependent oxidoreductase [Cystobacterineae bacterium]|nr:FAD-dependent oxidoreductase [Cystobacterineae bacterium]